MFLSERTLDRIVDQLNFDLRIADLTTQDEEDVLAKEGLICEMRDQLFVPNNMPYTYKISKLAIINNFDLLKFVDHIIETIPLPFEVSLNVGFFINRNETVEYIKPTSTQSLVMGTITNLEHYWKFRKEILNVGSNIVQAGWENGCDRRQIPIPSCPKHFAPALINIYLRKLK